MNAFFSPPQLVGYVALVLGVAAFLQKKDRRLKQFSAGESLVYVAHFILLNNLPAAGSAGVACLRTLMSLRTRSPRWAALFWAASLAIGVVFAKTAVAWLPVAGSLLATGALFLLRGLPMRLVLLACTLLWLANNIISGSVGGTVLEAMIASVNLATMARLLAERRAARNRLS